MPDSDKKVSAAQRKATEKYLEKFDELRIRVLKGRKTEIQRHCEKLGESMNSFIIRAIEQTIQRDSMEVSNE